MLGSVSNKNFEFKWTRCSVNNITKYAHECTNYENYATGLNVIHFSVPTPLAKG